MCDGAKSIMMVAISDNPEKRVTDIGEIEFDGWDPETAEEVKEWMTERPSIYFEISSLRPDGHRYGADEGTEVLARANVR
jgi:hypothetical protein